MDSHLRVHIEVLTKFLNRSHEKSATGQNSTDTFEESEGYFHAVHAQQDTFMRTAYWLLNFLISAPPPYQSRQSRSEEAEEQEEQEEEEEGEEKLLDYDQEEARQQELVFENDDFSLEQSTLPLDTETDYKVNSLLFQACLTFVKPAFYFIAEEDMVPYTDNDSLEYNVTRVLANLVQLITVVRSVKEDDSEVIKTVVRLLLSLFDKLFTLKADEDQADLNDSFFKLYPDEAAKLTVFSVLQEVQTEDDFIRHKLGLSGLYQFDLNPNSKCEDYQNKVDQSFEAVKVALEESSTLEEFTQKIQVQGEFQEIKSILLGFAEGHAIKIIDQVNSTVPEELKISTPIHKMNYVKIFEELELEHQEDIKQVETNVENELLREFSTETDDLESRIAEINIEKKRLAEEHRILHDSNERDQRKLDALLLTNPSENNELSYEVLERDYPGILNIIIDSIDRRAIAFTSSKLSELERKKKELKRLLILEANADETYDDNGSDHNENHTNNEFSEHHLSGNSTPFQQSPLQSQPQPFYPYIQQRLSEGPPQSGPEYQQHQYGQPQNGYSQSVTQLVPHTGTHTQINQDNNERPIPYYDQQGPQYDSSLPPPAPPNNGFYNNWYGQQQ